MAKFIVRFERYRQEAASIEVEAEDLDSALAYAAALDEDEHRADFCWEDEDEVTRRRIFGVEDAESGYWLAQVRMPVYGPTWFSVCLANQWKNRGQPYDVEAAITIARDRVKLVSTWPPCMGEDDPLSAWR